MRLFSPGPLLFSCCIFTARVVIKQTPLLQTETKLSIPATHLQASRACCEFSSTGTRRMCTPIQSRCGTTQSASKDNIA
ncbi:hypothetical protein M758_3G021400 [Ceratodon purpureus]|nr:hypothetical protein M758_3G021400 [Ceratodon purpureus]